MPLVDVQRSLRELGRLRLGTTTTYEKKGGGTGTRPVRLARYRLTSAWRHLIDGAAELYGGEVKPWDSPSGPQFEVIVDETLLPVVIPPGTTILSQWWELWSGGGCVRRCDGVRQVKADKPCQCPDELGDRLEAASQNPPQACKPTTRLMVMLPDVADVGVWRMETKGIHAATELMGAIGLVELATTRGIWVPATLGIEERRALKDGKTSRFVVPVVGFRGALSDVLPKLGITGADFEPVKAIETRPALDTGGAAALPAAPTGFGEASPIEEATLPEEPIAEPEAFEPPPPERDPEEAKADLSWAQMAAMRANDAGLTTDRLRHGVYLALTAGAKSSGKDLDGTERAQAMALLVRMIRGTVALGYAEVTGLEAGLWVLIDSTEGPIHSSAPIAGRLTLELVAPTQHAGKPWTLNPEGEAAPPPAAEPSEPAPAADSSREASPPAAGPVDLKGPSPLREGIGTEDELRAAMKTAKLRVSDLMKVAAQCAPELRPQDLPGNLPALVAMPDLLAKVIERLELKADES